MESVSLRGITWNHSRALPPLVATAQRFEELTPRVQIEWKKRSLHEFGHADLGTLARTFDLLVIDHPMTGDAEADGLLVDLLPLLPEMEIEDMKNDSLGECFSSYVYNGKLYALPIDAAAPGASFRPDLMDRLGLEEPKFWEDVLALARRGWVRMPGFSADIFLNFMGLCVSRGSAVAASADHLIDQAIGAECLEQLSEIAALMPDDIYQLNPIALYERMAVEETIAYCPFAYTYSNYSRDGFGAGRLRFTNPVELRKGVPMRTVLGGTGIAISTGCKNPSVALEYGRYLAGKICQRTLYGICGGQPARRSAWEDGGLNELTDNFFRRTAASIENAYVRPRYRGYVGLQERAGEVVAEFCQQRGNPRRALERIDGLYHASLNGELQHV
jgi:multiple sugar transport system substrate-binding protein